MKSQPEIIFLFKNFKLHNGGNVSAFELAETISLLGYNVHIGIFSFDPLIYNRIKIIKKERNGLKLKFHYIPGFFFLDNIYSQFQRLNQKIKELLKTNNKNSLKETFEVISSIFFRKKNIEFENIVSESKIIFIIASLSGTEIETLKKKTNALLIKNHAGSPDTFKEYWLNETHKPDHYSLELSLYVNYFKCFDKILFQSKFHANECKLEHPSLKKKVITVYPTCNEDEINSAKKSNNPFKNEITAIVNIGSIQPRKAQYYSIEAFAIIANQFPSAQLHFVGGWKNNKKYFLSLKEKIKEFKLEKRIFFHGHRTDYLRFMLNAKMLLQTSKAEGVSRVLREAMYMKLPIVSFAISGTSDILSNEEAILTEPGNVNELASGLALLLANPVRRKQLAENAYKRYQLRHSKNIYRSTVKKIIKNHINAVTE
jgi:glycosyltransferase involved in cell wall biosynthesis